MDKRIFLYLIILVFLQSCASTPPPLTVPAITISPIPASATQPDTDVPEISIKTITPTLEPTQTPQPTKHTNPLTSIVASLTPDIAYLTEIPEPTVIYHAVLTPTTPLDPKSYRSVLDWIKFSLANQDLSIIESLTREKVSLGYSEAEYIDVLTKAELIDALSTHIAPGTQCLAYTYRAGEINGLYIFIANWEPDWQYLGRRTNDLLLSFSDQHTPDIGLSLDAVAVPHTMDQYYVADFLEHMCFE
jgi:hypothetical protein